MHELGGVMAKGKSAISKTLGTLGALSKGDLEYLSGIVGELLSATEDLPLTDKHRYSNTKNGHLEVKKIPNQETGNPYVYMRRQEGDKLVSIYLGRARDENDE